MRIGLFGGAFDPFHNGHLSMIKGALKSGLVDMVIVIPSVRSPFKRGKVLSAAPYRYYMTCHAIDELTSKDKFKGKVFVSDIEFSIPGISYTVNTVHHLIEKDYIESFLMDNDVPSDRASEFHSYYWICGSDILPDFDKWYEPGILLSMVSLLCARRPGEPDRQSDADSIEKEFNTKIKYFEINGVESSSHEIRVSHDYKQVPSSVNDFIETHALYKDSVLDYVSDDTARSFLNNANDLYFMLKEKRLLHTLNVGLLSAKLAHTHGADADKALIAGELHDCAKEIDISEQLRMAKIVACDTFTDKKLLHSPAGAYLAFDYFRIQDKEILNAIEYHTTGRGDMTMLDKIVYLSDKIEPARTYTDLTEIRETTLKDLDAATRMCLNSVILKFKKQGRDLHPLTSDFDKSLRML